MLLSRGAGSAPRARCLAQSMATAPAPAGLWLVGVFRAAFALGRGGEETPAWGQAGAACGPAPRRSGSGRCR